MALDAHLTLAADVSHYVRRGSAAVTRSVIGTAVLKGQIVEDARRLNDYLAGNIGTLLTLSNLAPEDRAVWLQTVDQRRAPRIRISSRTVTSG